MSSRLGFAVSLLAACGIHGAVLLVPRVSGPPASLPAMELELEGAPGPTALPAPARRAAASVLPGTPRAVDESAPGASTPPPEQPSAQPETAARSQPLEPAAATVAAPSSGVASLTPSAAVSAGPAEPAAGSTGAPHRPTASPSAAPAGSSSPALVLPRPRASIRPSYPREARSAGIQGVVRLSVEVDPRGAVTAAAVLASSGNALLDSAALDAVRHASFEPATESGRPVSCRVIVPVRFRLSDAP